MQYGSTGAKRAESNENVNISYKYNNQGLVSEQSYVLNGTSHNIQYNYDSRGNCIKVRYEADGKNKNDNYNSWSSGEAWKYTYDAKNRLVSVYNEAHLSSEIANYSYDLNGNVLRKAYGNELVSEYKYNAANQVVSVSNSQYGSFLSDFEYSYNVDGNLTSVLSNYTGIKYIDQKNDNDEDENIKSIKTNYTYDGFGRLISEDYHKQKEDNSVNTDVKKTYEYDVFGNRTKMNVNEKNNITFGSNVYSTDYTYDDENKLLKEKMSTGEVSKYEYDNNGNQTKKVDGVEGIARVNMLTLGIYGPNESKFKTERRTYDAFNQLTEVSTNGVSARYSYRPDGLRLTKDIDGKHTDFVWNGSQILAEIDDGLEENLKSYSYGLERIKCNHSRETEFYYAYNAHGDVVQLVGDSGFENHDPEADNFIFKNLLKDYEYDAFGVEVDKDESDVNSFRYCGEYFDDETDSIYLRARYYNPANGRFTTEDPARDGENWYGYCGGNPVMLLDRSGLKPGDVFDTLDSAAIDAGNYLLALTFDNDEEMCAVFYAVEGGFTYCEAENVAENKVLSFQIFWDDNPIAYIHTHVFYDVDNINDNFSNPDNVAIPGTGGDTQGSDDSGLPVYLATPYGNLRKYTPNSDNLDGDLISSELIIDPKYKVYKQIVNTFIWRFLEHQYPYIDKMDIVKAKTKYPDDLYDMFKELGI